MFRELCFGPIGFTVRYNVKVNVVPYTPTFAFAMGFRANWDIKPSTLIHPKRRIALLSQLSPSLNRIYSIYQQQNNQSLNYQYPYNQYSRDQQNEYTNNQYQQYQSNQYTSDLNKNNQFVNYQYQRFNQPHAYYQRAIHSAIRSGFDWHGMNGTACLQRTICEVSTIHEDDIVSQIFKIVFNGTEDFDCPEDIQCPVSLLQLVDHILTHQNSVPAN